MCHIFDTSVLCQVFLFLRISTMRGIWEVFDKCCFAPYLHHGKLLSLFGLKPVILTQRCNMKEEQVLFFFFILKL